MIQLWKRKKGQRQGSLATPPNYMTLSLQPPLQLMGHQSKDFLLRRKKGPQPRLVLRRKYSYLRGSFSSEGNFQVNK